MTRTTMGLLAGLMLSAPLAAGAAVIDVAVFGDEVELSTFDAPVEGGALSLAAGYDAGGPPTAEGGFEVVAEDELLLDGVLATLAAPGDGTLELAFADLAGPGAAAFGSTALVTLDFGGALGADPLAAFGEGGAYEASIALASPPGASPAPIPLPASGALMLAAALGLGVAGRRR